MILKKTIQRCTILNDQNDRLHMNGEETKVGLWSNVYSKFRIELDYILKRKEANKEGLLGYFNDYPLNLIIFFAFIVIE